MTGISPLMAQEAGKKMNADEATYCGVVKKTMPYAVVESRTYILHALLFYTNGCPPGTESPRRLGGAGGGSDIGVCWCRAAGDERFPGIGAVGEGEAEAGRGYGREASGGGYGGGDGGRGGKGAQESGGGLDGVQIGDGFRGGRLLRCEGGKCGGFIDNAGRRGGVLSYRGVCKAGAGGRVDGGIGADVYGGCRGWLISFR
ncbi:hypothetical protein VTI74DRAFT_5180 [Chaetomium olivicolor]